MKPIKKGGEHLAELLNDDNKQINQATGTLSRLFRIILKAYDVRPSEWNQRLQAYAYKHAGYEDPVSSGSIKSNLSRAMREEAMSWKTFERGLDFLGAQEVVVTVEILRHGKLSKHTIKIDIGQDNVDDLNTSNRPKT